MFVFTKMIINTYRRPKLPSTNVLDVHRKEAREYECSRLQVLCGCQSKVWKRRSIVPGLVHQPTDGQIQAGLNRKTMSEEAGFTAMHVNHSGRKTCVTKLLDAGCFPTEVAQLTGHTNLMSLNHYHTVNIDKQNKCQECSIINSRPQELCNTKQ